MKREIKQLITAAVAQGCIYRMGGKHGRLLTPAGGMVVIPLSPGGTRGIDNAKAELRRRGVKI